MENKVIVTIEATRPEAARRMAVQLFNLSCEEVQPSTLPPMDPEAAPDAAAPMFVLEPKKGPGRPAGAKNKRTDQKKGATAVAAPASAPVAAPAPAQQEPAASGIPAPAETGYTQTKVSQAVVRFARHTSMDEAAALLRSFKKADGGPVARASDLDPSQYGAIIAAIEKRRTELGKPEPTQERTL